MDGWTGKWMKILAGTAVSRNQSPEPGSLVELWPWVEP